MDIHNRKNMSVKDHQEKNIEQPAFSGEISEKLDPENQSTNLKLLILKAIMAIYGIITLPIYFLLQQPWKVWKDNEYLWAKHQKGGDPHSPVEQIPKPNDVSTAQNSSNLDELFRNTVSMYGSRKCHGVRKVLDEVEEFDKTGQIIRKVLLGDYQWFDYIDTARRVKTLSKGLLALGLESKQRIIIFAETRREWFLVLHACFRINVVVGTIYATLGEDGIVHGINEIETSMIVTSQDLLPKLRKIADKIPLVTKIVYMENFKSADKSGFPSKMSIYKLSEIEQMGENYDKISECQPAAPNDVAVIMYTSGSTGMPKGVLISHKNIISMLAGMQHSGGESQRENDITILFLPMAHIYEMVVELSTFCTGVYGGYASPNTLTETSPGLMSGCKGDLFVLKPNLMFSVPLVLDRMRKAVNEAVAARGAFVAQFFKYAINYNQFWREKGFNTPILNRILFRKVRDRFGGQLRIVISSGAHLSVDTAKFIQSCLNVQFSQCYGITELSAAGTVTRTGDINKGRVGCPYNTCFIKLVDWNEGGYKVTDKPYPRGEIVMGGPCVTLGYFKNAKLTKEVYREEDDGSRWVYTGDIGQLFPNGTFKIIDRKKELHKLPHGEYVSLGKVEAELKTSPLVENICVLGSISHAYLIALVSPNEAQLRNLAATQGKKDWTFTQLCQDHELTEAVTGILRSHGRINGLLNREIPQKIKLCFEEWTPEIGLMTAALKIKRKSVEKFYQEAVNEMFTMNT